MDDLFPKRVRAAAIAGWWTVLIGAIWLTAVWLIWLGLTKAHPGWVLCLWGSGDVTWAQVEGLTLQFFAIMKLLLWTAVLVCVWLSIWACKLRNITA